jgi:hypothetical protein
LKAAVQEKLTVQEWVMSTTSKTALVGSENLCTISLTSYANDSEKNFKITQRKKFLTKLEEHPEDSEDNLDPKLPRIVSQSEDIPIAYDSKVLKNDENDVFDEERLLKSLNLGHHNKAKLLLKYFNERPNEFTWNSSGVIFIDQTSVPNSNIFQIFPHLFKVKKSSQIPGLLEAITKIYDMGLGDLIVQKLKTNSESKLKPNPESASKNEVGDHWWYLGP